MPARLRGDALADAIEMFGQASLAPPGLRVFAVTSAAGQANADSSPPRIEGVEYVVLAEINLHGTAAHAFRVIPNEVGVDALARDLERDALRRPAAHSLEGRSDDSDEMAVVLAAKIGFDFAAVLVWAHRGGPWPRAQRGLFLSHTILNPCSVRSGSTCSMRSTSGAMMPANPPVAMQTAFGPSSARMRRTTPSTRPT